MTNSHLRSYISLNYEKTQLNETYVKERIY